MQCVKGRVVSYKYILKIDITIKNKHILLLEIIIFITKQIFYVEVTFQRVFGKNQLNSTHTILLHATQAKDSENSFSSIAHGLILEKSKLKVVYLKRNFLFPLSPNHSSISSPVGREVMLTGVPQKTLKRIN